MERSGDDRLRVRALALDFGDKRSSGSAARCQALGGEAQPKTMSTTGFESAIGLLD